MDKTTKTYLLPYIFFSVLGYILYFHIRGYGFTYLDDASLIIDSAAKFSADPLSIIRLFTQNHLSALQPQIFYRPVFAASFMLNSIFKAGGLSGYYFTNIALHIAASCLVYSLLLKLKYNYRTAILLTTLYVIHPMLTQTVAWLPGRSDTLVAVFSIASFIAFIEFTETGRIGYYLAHILSLALALFSKENSLCLVLICFLYMRIIIKEKLFYPKERYLAIGWLIVLTLWFVLRNMALVKPLKITFHETAGYLAANSIVIVQYIGRIFFPVNLSVWPTILDSQWIPGAVSIIALVILLYISKDKRMNYCLFGAAWFILFLLPALVRPSVGVSAVFSNTRVCLSMAGILIILAETDMIKHVDIKKWPQAALILLAIIFYSLIAYDHSCDFRNGRTFWENARRTTPHSWVDPKSHFNQVKNPHF
ncbi:MAG: hypothetical protein Q7S30_05975 [Candidatus Omnitrophota bacterium]|nr:hypothetical protein [Candidatus Omnitrophota bacterium]